MNALPQIVRKDGPQIELPREEKAYAYRVEAKTLRRVEQRNRTQDVELQNQYKLVNLEQAVLQAAFKKQRVTFKKRIIYYNKTMSDLNDLKGESGQPKAFLTEIGAPVSGNAAAESREAAAAAARIAFDLDALGSVRRKTKPVLGAAAVCRALADLGRLQRKNLREFGMSMDTLRKLEAEVGMTVDVKIPARTYTPPISAGAPFKPSAYLMHLRRQVAAMEKELKQLELKRYGYESQIKSAAGALCRAAAKDSGEDGDGEADAGGRTRESVAVGVAFHRCSAAQGKRMVTFDIDEAGPRDADVR